MAAEAAVESDRHQARGGTGDAPPLVDTHFHVYEQSMPLADGAWHHPGEDASTERALAVLDGHGIPLGVISAASIYGTYNDYVRQALKRHRRLRATLMPDLGWDIHTMEAYRDEGFTGVRFLWRPKPDLPDIASEPYRRLLRRCADLGWHATSPTGRSASTAPSARSRRRGVVLDHMALIDTDLGVDDPGFRAALDAVDRGRTWVKLSGGFRFTRPGLADAAARALVAAGGWERLMWASDWPFAGFEEMMSYGRALADLTRWVPDADMRAAVAGATALRFYFG